MPGGPHPPPSVIASWPKPNYVDPVSHGDALPVVCIVFPAIAIVLVTARVYSRVFITKAPGLDDLLVTISLGFLIALAVVFTISARSYHLDRHVWDIPLSLATPNRLTLWVAEYCYVAASSCVKISILLFYRRLSISFSRTFKVATWLGIAYNVGYLVGFFVAITFQCRPVSAYWNAFSPAWLEKHSYVCHVHENISLPMAGGLSVIGDLYSTLLPFCLVYSLDLPKRQKVALYVLFAFGFLAVASGVVRMYYYNVAMNRTYDFSWPLYNGLVWTMVELFVSIFAASAPALKPFFRKFFLDPISTLASSSQGEKTYLMRSRSSNYNRYRSAKNLRAAAPDNIKPGAGMLGQLDSAAHRNTDHPGDLDVEKIGVAVTRDGAIIEEDDELAMFRYHPKSSQRKQPPSNEAGTEKPPTPFYPATQTHHGQASLDSSEGGGMSRQPSQSQTVSSQDWILPPATGGREYNDPLRSYRAEIEALPPLPSEQTNIRRSASLDQQRRVSNPPVISPAQRPTATLSRSTSASATVPALNQAFATRYSGLNQHPPSLTSLRAATPTDRPRLLPDRHPSRGSVRAARVRAQQVQAARVRDHPFTSSGIDYTQPDPPIMPSGFGSPPPPVEAMDFPRPPPHDQRQQHQHQQRQQLRHRHSDFESESESDWISTSAAEPHPRNHSTVDRATSPDRKTWNTNTLRLDKSESPSSSPSPRDEDHDLYYDHPTNDVGNSNIPHALETDENEQELPRQGSRDDFHHRTDPRPVAGIVEGIVGRSYSTRRSS